MSSGLCCLLSHLVARTQPIHRPDRVRTSSWVQGRQERTNRKFSTPRAFIGAGVFAFVSRRSEVAKRQGSALLMRLSQVRILLSEPGFEVLAVSEAASHDSLKVEGLVRIQDGQP